MKQELRGAVKERIGGLGEEQVIEKSRKIAEKVLALREFREAGSVMLFVGLKDEVQTKEIIEKALLLGKRVFVPVTDFGKNEIVPAQIFSLRELHEKKFGLLEPKEVRAAGAEELELVIVPGIAFDLQGNRLGRGRGFFDRFLKRLSGKAKKIALAFEEQIVERVPAEKHDVKVDKIVSEKRAIVCGKS